MSGKSVFSRTFSLFSTIPLCTPFFYAYLFSLFLLTPCPYRSVEHVEDILSPASQPETGLLRKSSKWTSFMNCDLWTQDPVIPGPLLPPVEIRLCNYRQQDKHAAGAGFSSLYPGFDLSIERFFYYVSPYTCISFSYVSLSYD